MSIKTNKFLKTTNLLTLVNRINLTIELRNREPMSNYKLLISIIRLDRLCQCLGVVVFMVIYGDKNN